uniref:Uncharacterized protein MANES_06G112600 n=1 Tax=Rhizophora mucronata TaxID=61149 RepID=A0A2P2JHC8_RHIMU
MRIEDSSGGHRVPNEDSNNLCAPAGGQFQDFDVLPVREVTKKQKASGFVRNYLVGRRVRWEKCELCCH